MRTLWINKTAIRANRVAWLVTNRITLRIQRNRHAFVQIATLLPLVTSDNHFGREHDSMRVRFNNNRLRLRQHGFFAKVTRVLVGRHRINLGALRALR